ncbi:MAG: hypothetical protein FJ293_16590 [Planctomycetes bacterium]|nr:hypothetical protein [Planctomycetota bacterium]
MTFVCATHPNVDATARCIRCGLHLCAGCRSLDGVRNYCVPCRQSMRADADASMTAAAVAASGAGIAVAVDRTAPAARQRSPWLAASLSIVPGLGQAYTGRVLRGAGSFGAALLLRDAPFMTPLLGAFLYVFGMFDAFRCAEAGSADAAAARKGRIDDVLFLLAGLLVLAATLAGHGGVAAAPRELLLPVGAIGAALLFAHESRR